MSNTNGTPVDLAELKETKERLRLEIQVKQLERRKRSEEITTKTLEAFDNNWVYAYAGLLDTFRREPFNSISTTADRRGGRNFPFFVNETDLNLYRAPARIICGANSYAIGIMGNLVSYVIGEGFNYEATERGATAKTKRAQDAAKDPDIQAAQKEWDRFAESCNWWDLEQELFWRDHEDGESLLHHGFDWDNELTWVRTVEPEQVYLPTSLPSWLANVDEDHPLFKAYDRYVGQRGSMSWTDWLRYPEASQFGVFTNPEDVQTVFGYAVHHFLNPAEWDFCSTSDTVHSKINTKRSIKRGLTDFCLGTYDALEMAEKLRHYMVVGSTVRSGIVGFRQHDTASIQQVQAFQAQQATQQRLGPGSGGVQSYATMSPGSMIDVPKGQNVVAPPTASNDSVHVDILNACLRGAGTRWSAPPWMAGADGGDTNYATSLTIESPFVKRGTAWQRYVKSRRERTWWIVMRNAVVCGRLRAEALRKIMPKIEAPQIAVRDVLQQAQTDQIYVAMGEKSLKTVSMEQGRDYAEEQANISEHQEMNPQLPGLELPGDGDDGEGTGQDGGGKKPTPAKPYRPTAEGRGLLEKKDASGHEHAADGKFGKGGTVKSKEPAKAKTGATTEKEPSEDVRHIVDEILGVLGDETEVVTITDGLSGNEEETDASESLEPNDQPQQLIPAPDIRQHDHYSCGACAAMSIGRLFHVGPATLEEWKAALGTTEQNSTSPQAIIDYLGALGLSVEAKQDMAIDDLRQCWQEGRPVLCPIQEYGVPSKHASFLYGHYVVVIGVSLGFVFVQDSSIENALKGQGADQSPGRMIIDEATWLRVWHDRDATGNKYVRYGIAVGPGVQALANATTEARETALLEHPEWAEYLLDSPAISLNEGWVTIGASKKKGQPGKHGGVRVFIDANGKIIKGPKHMTGHHISKFDKSAKKPAKKDDKGLALGGSGGGGPDILQQIIDLITANKGG